MARRGIKYPKDYVSFWNEKGEYGKQRVLRMRKRKELRYWKQKAKQERNRNRYGFPFQCDMGYADCEQRGWCNGDC